MRFSILAFIGLAALSGKYGADARAVPNDLALSSSSLAGRDFEAVEHPKRGVASHIVARVPATPGLPAPAPKPVLPKPVLPKPVTNPNAPKSQGGTYKKDPEAQNEENTCGIVPTKRSLGKRVTPRTPEDAWDSGKVYLWLRWESGVDRNKIVFYADSGKFEPVARAFVQENPGYKHFWTIFTKDFEKAFGGVSMANNGQANIACSEALGMYARNPLVFNHDNAPATSYWRQYELPKMWNAGKITQLKDDARTPADVKSTIPNPPKGDC